MKDMEEPVESENVHSRSSDGPRFGSLLVAQVQLGPAGPFGTSANARCACREPPLGVSVCREIIKRNYS